MNSQPTDAQAIVNTVLLVLGGMLLGLGSNWQIALGVVCLVILLRE